MGARWTLVLLLVVAALGALLWFTDQKPPAAVSVQISALDGRSLIDCRRMRWVFPDLQPIEINRGKDGAFWLAEPIIDLASRAYLQQIFTAWNTAQLLATEYQDDFQGRKETGLETPELTFLAEWPDGHQVKYDVGGSGPIGTTRFLRRDGKIWRGDDMITSMRVGLDDLRERSVFRTMEPQCTELRVDQLLRSGKREVLHLQRAPDRQWRMLSPFPGRTEQGAAIQFVTAVLALRADQFLPGIVRREGDPTIKILAQGAYGEEALDLWEEGGAAYGQLPGRISSFQSDHRPYAAVFVNAVDDLRAKVLVPMGSVAEHLAEVVIDPGQGRGDRIHLVRDSVGEDWRLVEPVTHPALATPCGEMIQAINNLRAIEFVDGATAADERFGLGATRLSVAVRAFDQKQAQVLWLGKSADRQDMPLVYACRADEPNTVVLVPKPALEQLQRPWTTYCARDVVRVTVPIERIDLQGRSGGAPRVFKVDGGHWVLDGTPGHRDEVGEYIQNELPDLRGKAVIDLRGNPFGEPDWIVKLCRAKGDVLTTIRIWDRGKDAPLLVQPEAQTELGFELGLRDGNALRELWQ